MTEKTPYRRNAYDDENKLSRQAEDLLAVLSQEAIDEELEVTQRNIEVIRRHLSEIALRNNGVVPIEQAHDVLNQFLDAKI